MNEIDAQIVMVDAVDWLVVEAQVPQDFDFTPAHGFVTGFLIDETEDHIVVSHAMFSDGSVRHTTSIPVKMINSITHLVPERGEANNATSI